MLYLALTLLFVCSAGLTYGYIRYAWRHNWIDIPNERSSHTQLTPRGGGLVFMSLWVIASLLAGLYQLLPMAQLKVLLPGAILVAAVGFCDDRFDLSARLRALAYLLAAISSVLTLGGFNQLTLNQNCILPLGLFGAVLAVLAILWSTNLFNFMDGLDGLAAVEALFILSVGGYFFAHSGAPELALLTWGLAVCVAGFLIWNKPPAKIFMGDMGSASLGFMVMVLALWGEQHYQLPALLWLILYAVFLVDATLTLLRRLLAGEPVYKAHRLHAYQRLHQAGFSHKKVLLIIIAMNTFLALLAISGFYYPNYLAAVAATALLLSVSGYVWVERIKPMYPKKLGT